MGAISQKPYNNTAAKNISGFLYINSAKKYIFGATIGYSRFFHLTKNTIYVHIKKVLP
jgi:hypothetical protein